MHSRRSLLPLLFLTPCLLLGAARAQQDFIQEVKLAVDRANPTARAADLPRLSGEEERRLEEVLRKRLPILAPKGGKVVISGPEEILVKAPGGKSLTPGQLSLLSRPGLLELRQLEDVRTGFDADARYTLEAVQIQNRISYRIRDNRSGRPIQLEQFLKQCPLMADTGDLQPNGAQAATGGAWRSIRLTFNANVTRRLRDFNDKAGRVMAVILDGEVLSLTPSNRTRFQPAQKERGVKESREARDARRKAEAETTEQLRDQAGRLDITGGFATEEEAAGLAVVLNSGALPVPLKVVSSRVTAE